MKKIAFFIVVFCTFLVSLTLTADAGIKEPSLIVLGEVIKNIEPPIIEKGKVYVPIRVVSEALGYNMEYNSKTKVIDIKKGSFYIKLTVGNKNAMVNGKKVELDKAPYLVNGRAYVPDTFIYPGFCVSAEFNKDLNLVKIGSLNPTNKNEKNDKGMYIFDKKADKEFSTIIMDKKVMIPLRPLGEGLGYDITWDMKTQTMALIKENKSLSFMINKDKAIVDGKELKMDEKTLMTGGRAYVSMTFLEKVMDYGFQYSEEAKKLTVKGKEVPAIISKVQDISYDEESGYPQLYISADNPVEYNTFTLDNPDRMVIDINNAIADTDFEVKEINSGEIIGVRIGQFSNQPKIVRVVVDLKNKKKAMVTQSTDKKNISLAYANIIQPITIEKEGYCDVITIKGSQAVDSQLFSLNNPDRIVIDVQQAVLDSEKQSIPLNNSSIIKSVRTGQFDVGTARIVVDLGKSAFYDIKNEGNESKIYISDIPFSFMGYDKYYNSSYITMNPNDEVDFKTDFDKKKNILKVEINKDIEYENELYEINDNLLEYIKLSKTQQKKNIITKAEFKLKEKVEYEILSPSDSKLIKLKLTYIPTTPRDVMVVIDAGHGGKDPGAKAVDGTYEKNYNIDVARRLDKKLKELGFSTIMTREEDIYTTLQERTDAANWNYADFFISIHFNAYMNKAKGIETLYYPNTPTEAYSINNKDIASIFQEEILKALKRPSRGVISRPDLFVLNKTKMPAMLMELGFLTNKEELSFIKKESYRENAANALATSLLRYYKEIQGIDFGEDTRITAKDVSKEETAVENVVKR